MSLILTPSYFTIFKVPILRVYGATQVGQKACIHIHGVFPYLMFPYKDVIGQVGNRSYNCISEGNNIVDISQVGVTSGRK